MRKTVDELQAMHDQELYEHWFLGRFPFDLASCGNCLTQHTVSSCHPAIARELLRMEYHWLDRLEFAAQLRKHLDELYALRLFHDELYPQKQKQEIVTPANQEEPCC